MVPKMTILILSSFQWFNLHRRMQKRNRRKASSKLQKIWWQKVSFAMEIYIILQLANQLPTLGGKKKKKTGFITYVPQWKP